ncbi:MAG: hypothetical protein KDD69_17270 [Bdellovibrionales bacterium]|nr:hypothetical protein [Bdellovibrionales bacterium]
MCSRGRLVLALIVLVLLAGGCSEPILHELDEGQANQVRLALAQSGIDAEKVREGSMWSIAVDSRRSAAALAEIERRRLLPLHSEKPSDSAAGFLPTREERRHRLQEQLSLSLGKTLEQFPGVIEARVHIASTPLRTVPGIESAAGETAGVLLVGDESQIVVDKVRQLVSGATGLDSERISVVVVADEAPATVGTVRAPEPPATPSLQALAEINPLWCAGVGMVLLTALMTERSRSLQRSLRKRANE